MKGNWALSTNTWNYAEGSQARAEPEGDLTFPGSCNSRDHHLPAH